MEGQAPRCPDLDTSTLQSLGGLQTEIPKWRDKQVWAGISLALSFWLTLFQADVGSSDGRFRAKSTSGSRTIASSLCQQLVPLEGTVLGTGREIRCLQKWQEQGRWVGESPSPRGRDSGPSS